jgi:hypothetical protein
LLRRPQTLDEPVEVRGRERATPTPAHLPDHNPVPRAADRRAGGLRAAPLALGAGPLRLGTGCPRRPCHGPPGPRPPHRDQWRVGQRHSLIHRMTGDSHDPDQSHPVSSAPRSVQAAADAFEADVARRCDRIAGSRSRLAVAESLPFEEAVEPTRPGWRWEVPQVGGADSRHGRIVWDLASAGIRSGAGLRPPRAHRGRRATRA